MMHFSLIFFLLLFYLYGFTSPPIEETTLMEKYVELHPFLHTPFQDANKAIGCQPLIIDIAPARIQEIYAIFSRGPNFKKICEITSKWAEEFTSLEESPWKNTNYRFGIFDKSKPTHKKSRLIQGINCKLSREYYDWIQENHNDELSAIPELGLLFNQLMKVEEICHTALVSKVQEIAQSYPNIKSIFYNYEGELRIPLSIRITRYDNTGNFCLPLHYDLSALSLILPSDDDPYKECLILASPKNFSLDNLKRPRRAVPSSPIQISGILIAGALMPFLDVPIQPSPHAVLPHNRDARYVIVICCHIPNMCTSHLNSVLNDMHDMPEKFKQKWKLSYK